MAQVKNIKEQIGFLIELQVLDCQIYTLNREKDGFPAQIKTIEAALEKKKIGIKQAEDNLKNLQVKLKEKEITIQQKEEQIKKLQGQLYQLKTNKDYTAMSTEIGGIKADNSVIEEEMLKLMDEIDIGKKKIKGEKELFEKETEASQKEKNVVDARIKEINSNLSELSAKRGDIDPKVDKQLLARYERVLKNRDGIGMGQVVDGICGGCHMNLPPQVISEVKIRETVMVCGSCSRILYMDENVAV